MVLDYEKIGKRIKKYRKEADLSQEELAEKVWISVTHMSHIETGSTKLSLPVLADIASALNVSTDVIIMENDKADKNRLLLNLERELNDCSAQEIMLFSEIVRSIKKYGQDGR